MHGITRCIQELEQGQISSSNNKSLIGIAYHLLVLSYERIARKEIKKKKESLIKMYRHACYTNRDVLEPFVSFPSGN
jgi:hypothetical protein